VSRRHGRLPKGARTAARILRFLGAGGTGTLLIVCLVVGFTAIGSKYVSTPSGQSACELADSVGGPGVEVFGDSTLLGLAHALPDTLAGGKVVEDVKAGRTAQQGENVLNDLPDSAPGVFVISLAVDDASSLTAYIARIDELRLLLSGRRVYWVTAPGKDAYTKIVNADNTASDPGSASGGHSVDFAASVTQHPDWWYGGKPTAAGLKNRLGPRISRSTPAHAPRSAAVPVPVHDQYPRGVIRRPASRTGCRIGRAVVDIPAECQATHPRRNAARAGDCPRHG
jgi:hypothetical protein